MAIIKSTLILCFIHVFACLCNALVIWAQSKFQCLLPYCLLVLARDFFSGILNEDALLEMCFICDGPETPTQKLGMQKL